MDHVYVLDRVMLKVLSEEELDRQVDSLLSVCRQKQMTVLPESPPAPRVGGGDFRFFSEVSEKPPPPVDPPTHAPKEDFFFTKPVQPPPRLPPRLPPPAKKGDDFSFF